MVLTFMKKRGKDLREYRRWEMEVEGILIKAKLMALMEP